MKLKIDWLHCEPRASWESMLHHLVYRLSSARPLTQAHILVRGNKAEDAAYELSLMLQLPGPDVQITHTGRTFSEALLKVKTSATRLLEARRPRHARQ
jgi:hypothetical protein